MIFFIYKFCYASRLELDNKLTQLCPARYPNEPARLDMLTKRTKKTWFVSAPEPTRTACVPERTLICYGCTTPPHTLFFSEVKVGALSCHIKRIRIRAFTYLCLHKNNTELGLEKKDNIKKPPHTLWRVSAPPWL